MAAGKDDESVLTSVVALATLFSRCVEAFGMIQPIHVWEKNEQLLLTRLGIQQARLLIWGDVLGISSPPAHIATHFVPTRPGAMNPDPNEAVYFGTRDSRLDDPELRIKIEDALNQIVDRPSHLDREQMMELYGLRPLKKGFSVYEQYNTALDTTRLEGFREKYALLLDVAQARANIASPRRGQSIVGVLRWELKDLNKFGSFIELVRKQIDSLVELFNVSERVDRAVKMDIKALGWHPEATRSQAAKEISKLKLVHEICQNDYPQYSQATQEALDNLNDSWKGHESYNAPVVVSPKPPAPPESPLRPTTNVRTEKKKRPGFLSLFCLKSYKSEKGRSRGLAVPTTASDETPRSKSESIPKSSIPPDLEPTRSKSVPHVPPERKVSPGLVPVVSRNHPENPLPDSAKGFDDKGDLAQIKTVEDPQLENLTSAKTFASMISRHDQHH